MRRVLAKYGTIRPERGHERERKMNRTIASAVAAAAFSVSLAAEAAAPTKGVWWWRGEDAASPDAAAKRFDFLEKRGVNEIYFCADWGKTPVEDIRRFVKSAGERGMRVACLAGDVSWIYPGKRGFAEILAKFAAYQASAAENERFYAIHLDVEPHQDKELSDERKWQLYADFVLRAAADVHALGEKVEWDIPFWLDNIRVAYGKRTDAPLLELLMDCSDCLTLMSYRDTGRAMYEVSKTEIDMAADRKGRGVRIVLGAETGQTGEGSVVTYYEEGEEKMEAELAKVSKALARSHLKNGCGVAVHHVGGWEKLAERTKRR